MSIKPKHLNPFFRSRHRPWRATLLATGALLAVCAIPLFLPHCLGSTNTVIETFDHWPPRTLAYYPAEDARATNILGNGALRLARSFPAATGWRWDSTGGGFVGVDLLRHRTVEHRLDLLKFTTTHGGYFGMGCLGFQTEELSSYLLFISPQKLVLTKYVAYPGSFARFLCEDIAFPLEQVTLVLRFQWAGDNLEIGVQVLDLANGNAVLFEQTAVDTPAKDPVDPEPWAPGSNSPNEDAGEPYWGAAFSWFSILQSEPEATSIEAVIDNCQWSSAGVGLDEFLGEVYTNAVSRTLPFRLFVPPGYDPAIRYPLVLSLHGAGDCGTDNRRQVEGQPGFTAFASPENQAKQPCFLLAPQSPGDWMSVVDQVLDLLTHLQAHYSIDPDHLYVTGLSMGGWGTLDYLAYRPELFAAGVPMSGAGATTKAPRIAQIPIWAFCGAQDTSFINDVRSMVEALRTAGGKPIYTEYSRGAHHIWTDAYQTPGLFDWLMRQRRGVPVAGPPEATIRLPTAEPVWTTLSTNLDLGCVVSPDFSVRSVMVTGRGICRFDGTNTWSRTAIPLTPAGMNLIIVKAYGPNRPAILGGETVLTDVLTVTQEQLLMEVNLLGDQLGLRWTPGADSYLLERCSDLTLGNWTPFQTTAATELILPRAERQQFYRVSLGP